jgi:hypothetical protein
VALGFIPWPWDLSRGLAIYPVALGFTPWLWDLPRGRHGINPVVLIFYLDDFLIVGFFYNLTTSFSILNNLELLL